MAGLARLALAASVLSCAPALSGCMTQLAPLYDQSISNELATANLDIHSLFVSVGTDAPLATYASRKPQYDHLVAELAAAELQIRARPVPNADSMTKAVKALERMHVRSVASDPNFSFYPSARAIADLEHSVREMQKGDEKGGLHGEAIQAFENEQTIFLTQAITYESFLKR